MSSTYLHLSSLLNEEEKFSKKPLTMKQIMELSTIDNPFFKKKMKTPSPQKGNNSSSKNPSPLSPHIITSPSQMSQMMTQLSPMSISPTAKALLQQGNQTPKVNTPQTPQNQSISPQNKSSPSLLQHPIPIINKESTNSSPKPPQSTTTVAEPVQSQHERSPQTSPATIADKKSTVSPYKKYIASKTSSKLMEIENRHPQVLMHPSPTNSNTFSATASAIFSGTRETASSSSTSSEKTSLPYQNKVLFDFDEDSTEFLSSFVKKSLTPKKLAEITPRGTIKERPVKSLKWLKKKMDELYSFAFGLVSHLNEEILREKYTLPLIFYAILSVKYELKSVADLVWYDLIQSVNKFKTMDKEVEIFSQFLAGDNHVELLVWYLTSLKVEHDKQKEKEKEKEKVAAELEQETQTVLEERILPKINEEHSFFLKLNEQQMSQSQQMQKKLQNEANSNVILEKTPNKNPELEALPQQQQQQTSPGVKIPLLNFSKLETPAPPVPAVNNQALIKNLIDKQQVNRDLSPQIMKVKQFFSNSKQRENVEQYFETLPIVDAEELEEFVTNGK